jgi:hypothetical protein
MEEETQVAQDKGYIADLYQVDKRQLPQLSVDFKPLGAMDEKGCASCNWFVSSDSCVLVAGDVYPTGICNLWHAKHVAVEKPLPVMIVGEELVVNDKSWFEKLAVKVKSFIDTNINSAPADSGPVQSDVIIPMVFFKSDDRMRFFATVTNCFKDSHKEILTASAHREYVEWATKTENYPELHLWHAGSKSRWGQVDWMEYLEGFVVASGLIDQDKEYIAEQLEKQVIGVSHGFIGIKTVQDGVVHKYRSYEISALPLESAANVWTNFNMKEVTMPFSEQKKSWLKDVAKVDDSTIATWEKDVEELSGKLKSMGLEYKEGGEESAPSLEVAALVKAVNDLSTLVAGQQAIITDLQKSVDQRISEAFVAEIAKLPTGFQATAETTNIVDEKDAKPDLSWFGELINGKGA